MELGLLFQEVEQKTTCSYLFQDDDDDDHANDESPQNSVSETMVVDHLGECRRCCQTGLFIYELVAPGSKEQAMACMAYGKILYDQDDLVEALRFYQKALVVLEAECNKSRDSAAASNNNCETEGLANNMRNCQDKVLGFNDFMSEHHRPLMLAKVLVDLGLVLDQLDELEESRLRFDDAVRIYGALAPESVDLAKTYQHLACALKKLGDLEGAYTFFASALEILEAASNKKETDDVLFLARTYLLFGKLLQDQRELMLEGAPNAFMRSLQIYATKEPVSQNVMVNGIPCREIDTKHQRKTEEARLNFLKAVEIFEREEPESIPCGEAYKCLGSVLQIQENWEGSRNYFEKALKIFERDTNFNRWAEAYSNLGDVCYSQGNRDSSERYHRKALTIQEFLAIKSLELAHTYLALGRIVDGGKGDPMDACQYYVKAMYLYEALKAGSSELAAACNVMGVAFKDHGDLGAARDSYQKASDIYEVTEPNSFLLANTLFNLACVLNDIDDELDESRQRFQQAAALYDSLAPGSFDLAKTHHHLAIVWEKLGELEQARDSCTIAVDILEAEVTQSSFLAKTLLNLGNILYGLEDIEAAFRTIQKSLEIYEVEEPGSHNVGITNYHLAWVLYNQKELEASRECFQQAVDIFERVTEPGSIDVARAYSGLGSVFQRQEKWSESRQYFVKALEVCDGDNIQREVASWYDDLGFVVSSQCEWDSAAQYFRKALEIHESLDPDSTDVVNVYENLGVCMYFQKMWDQAQQCFQRALEIREAGEPDYLSLASIYNNQGATFHQQRDLDRARACYQKAAEIVESQEAGPFLVAEIYLGLASVLYEQGDRIGSTQCYQKVIDTGDGDLSSISPFFKAFVTFYAANGYFGIGNILADEEAYEQSLCCYQKAWDMHKSQEDSRLEMFVRLTLTSPSTAEMKSKIALTRTTVAGLHLLSMDEGYVDAWCHVLSKCGSNAGLIYYFLRQQPALIQRSE